MDPRCKYCHRPASSRCVRCTSSLCGIHANTVERRCLGCESEFAHRVGYNLAQLVVIPLFTLLGLVIGVVCGIVLGVVLGEVGSLISLGSQLFGVSFTLCLVAFPILAGLTADWLVSRLFRRGFLSETAVRLPRARALRRPRP